MKKTNENFNMSLFSKYRDVFFGIAILIVIFHHLTIKGSGTIFLNAYMFLRSLGAMGVDIFLFLSGMGLYYSFGQDENIKAFLMRRLKRICPVYFLVCIPVYFVKDILSGKGLIVFLADLFQVSYWINGNAGEWYIAAIAVLYLLFPIIYRCVEHKRKYWLGIIILITWITVVTLVKISLPTIYYNTTTFWARIPIFIIGAYMGPLIREGRCVPTKKILYIAIPINIVTLLIEAIFALKGSEWAYSFMARLLYAPLSITFMIIFIICAERWRFESINKILSVIGNISLELYLTNQKFIALGVALISAIDIFANSNNVVFGNIIGVVLSFIVSFVIYYFLEYLKRRGED